MIRRTSILVLAGLVSVLSIQPMPVRTLREHDPCAIVWQSEARVAQPAEVRTAAQDRAPEDVTLSARPAAFARQPLLPAALHPRASPLVLPFG